MASVSPGVGRAKPSQDTAAGGYPNLITWTTLSAPAGKTVKRTAARPRQNKKKPKIPKLNRERELMGICARKYGKLTKGQRKVWKTICVSVIRHVGSLKHGSNKIWQVKGRLAFMSSCLLGYIRACDKQVGPIPDLPPDTIINILMFHFNVVDINRNPIPNAVVSITSSILKEKDNSDKVMYNQVTDANGYPPDFGMASNFQPYDIEISKTYQSQKKNLNVTDDMQVTILMC